MIGRYVTISILAIALALLLITCEAKAGGLFLDLDIGVHLQDWPEQHYNFEPALGSENPIGIMRIGYQTNEWNFTGPLSARAHAYYEHMSSAGTHKDSGVDVLMFGIRIE